MRVSQKTNFLQVWKWMARKGRGMKLLPPLREWWVQVSCCPFCLTGGAWLDSTHLCSPLALPETLLAWTATIVKVRRTGPSGGGRSQTTEMVKDIKNKKISVKTGIVNSVAYRKYCCKGGLHIGGLWRQACLLHASWNYSCQLWDYHTFQVCYNLAHACHLPSNFWL